MSLLAGFISSRIVAELEKQFVSHTPELQQAFLVEILNFIKVLYEWIENKTNAQGEPTDEKKEAKKMPERNIRNLDKKEPKMEKKKREPMKKKPKY